MESGNSEVPPCEAEMMFRRLPEFVALYRVDDVANELVKDPVFKYKWLVYAKMNGICLPRGHDQFTFGVQCFDVLGVGVL